MKTDEILYETPLTERLFLKAKSRKVPLSGTFELTPMCNFNCRMCYIHQTAGQVQASPRKMRTLEQWKTLGKQAAEEGLLYLLLTGGEPLLWPDFWELYDFLCGLGMVLSINTNGSLIDDRAVERFLRRPPFRVNITLYGASDETYEKLCGVKKGFTRVDRAITRLQKAGILVKLNCSLTPDNAADLEQMTSYAEERKLIMQVTTYMYPPIRRDADAHDNEARFSAYEAAWWHMERYRLQHTEERYRAFLKNTAEGLAEPIGLDESCYDPVDGRVLCRAGSASFWASWDGYLLPCGLMTRPKVDLEQMNFKDAWNQITDATEKIKMSGICKKCESRRMCHACAAMALAETGDFGGIPRYLCKMVDSMKKIASEQLKIYGV